jgi:hypothetical protein
MAKTMSYSFYCSRCKFDHAGECVVRVKIEVDTDGPKKARNVLDEIRELVKALMAGSYNARPTKLHQCRQDGACGVQGCDPSVPFLDDIRVKGDSISLSYRVKLRTPLKFIPITFQVTP